jgi:small GTP-binding protein
MDTFGINIGLFGCVSVGKSTFLNAITGKQYSDTEIKRTTMVPQVYMESSEPSDCKLIRQLNRQINDSIQGLSDFHICQPVYHTVAHTWDFCERDNRINIYDIPGLDDSNSKDIYFEWVEQNAKIFDIIIFMTDINHGLNSSIEIEILELLMNCVKKYGSKMICLINKCDDIYYDVEQNDLIFEEKEQENIYVQAVNILHSISKKYSLDIQKGDFTPFFPISSENCFIYRALYYDPSYHLDQNHLNRLCKNECGLNQWKKMDYSEKSILLKTIIDNIHQTYPTKIRDTGYLAVKNIINKTINTYRTDFVLHRLNINLASLVLKEVDDLSNYQEQVKIYYQKICQAKIYGVEVGMGSFWEKVISDLKTYVAMVTRTNTKVKYIDIINFKDFEIMHSKMQMHCLNFHDLYSELKSYDESPIGLLQELYEKITFKLYDIYQQISQYQYPSDHNCPCNLLRYLEISRKYFPQHFDDLAESFLRLLTNGNNRYYSIYPKESSDLIEYIYRNTDVSTKFHSFLVKILIAKQNHVIAKGTSESIPY